MAGIPEVLRFFRAVGNVDIDKFDKEHALVIRRGDEGSQNLEALPLP